MAFIACSGDAERAPESGALSYREGLVLSVVDDALIPFDAAASARGPAYAAPHAAALAAIGKRAAIALNRYGMAFLDFELQTMRLSISHTPSQEFHGRSVGTLFASTTGGVREFLLALYRHPDETEREARQGALLSVDADSGQSCIAALPEAIDVATLYSLFPFENGARLIATREIGPDRVRTGHWLWDPATALPPRAVDRSEFEDRLRPLGRAEAPAVLLAALDALTAENPSAPLLIETHAPSGELRWYALGTGPAADRVEVIAALDSGERAAVAAFPGGPVAACATLDDGSLRAERLGLKTPLPDAVWTSALLVADSSGAPALVLAWREDFFPEAGAAGLLIAPLFR